MKYNIQTNNRDIVSQICISELEFIITQVDFVQDKQSIRDLICKINRQIGNGIPMKLQPIVDCKECNSYSTCDCF